MDQRGEQLPDNYLRSNANLNNAKYDETDEGAIFADENMYKYHENTNEYDPKSQPYSYFYVTVAGQIQCGEFMELDGMAIHYEFVYGDDWKVAGGEKKGAGQHSFKGGYGPESSQKIVWNLEFECSFRSMNPHGWPQLVLYCTRKDANGNDIAFAYGCTHVPICPGANKKTIRMFQPVHDNSCKEFFGIFEPGVGVAMEKQDANIIAKAVGREIARVKAGGKIHVDLHVTQRNMERHGFITECELK